MSKDYVCDGCGEAMDGPNWIMQYQFGGGARTAIDHDDGPWHFHSFRCLFESGAEDLDRRRIYEATLRHPAEESRLYVKPRRRGYKFGGPKFDAEFTRAQE